MFPRMRIISAYLRLHILYPANVLILTGQLAQPWAAADITAVPGIHPYVINSWHYLFDPLKNIVPPVLFPHGNVCLSGTGLVRAEVKAAVTTLRTGKPFWWHTTSLKKNRPIRQKLNWTVLIESQTF